MKVLIIQLRQLGDVLLSSPLARVIKEEIQNSEVHFLTSEAGKEILKDNPYIDEIIGVSEGLRFELKTLAKIRKEKYDAVIDVQRTGRSKRLTLLSGAKKRIAFRKDKENLYYNVLIDWVNHGYTAWERMELLRGIGIRNPVKLYLPETFFPEKQICTVKGLIPDKKFVVIVPTARKSDKMWSLKNFARLIDFMEKELYIPSVVCYAPGEERFINELKRLSKSSFTFPETPLSIGSLALLIKKASLFVGNNSFASHLAVSQKVRTVVISKRKSGWFPPAEFVKEVQSEGKFPEFEEVKVVVKNVLS